MSAAHLVNDSLQPPFEKSFAGHETFAFRHAWLKKGVDQLLLPHKSEVFQREDAIVLLGVGKNMVRSIRHWCLATRVAEEEDGSRGRSLKPTPLGLRLFSDDGWDPYMEDDATLWLLHWNLASANTRAATWYWAFNKFHEYAFTRSAMHDALKGYLKFLTWDDIADSSIKRDIDCFVHTYLPRKGEVPSGEDPIGCPLTGLNLLLQEPDGERMRFRVGPKPTLPTAIFTYALAEFWNQHNLNNINLELRDLLSKEGSPTLVFRLDEDSVLSHLDDISEVTNGAVRFKDDALVRRIEKRDLSSLNSLSYLEAYYGKK